MAKRPSFQFYPADHMSDMELQSCSLAAQGLWLLMMCLMHKSARYGYLSVGEKPMLLPALSRAVGRRLQDVKRLVEELESQHVFSRDDDGTIYSRRMVRDEHIRTVRAEAGAKGAASTNGRLPGGLPDHLPTHLPEGLPQQNGQQKSGKPSRARAPSSSSSSLKALSQSVVKSDSVGELPAVAIADIPRNGAPHPPEVDSAIETRRRQLLQLATTGPPESDDSG